jgi:predicted Zn-dependent protease
VALARPDEAIAAVRKSLELDPSSLPVRSFLAELLARTNRSEEAAEERTTISRLKAAAASPYRPSAAATLAPGSP